MFLNANIRSTVLHLPDRRERSPILLTQWTMKTFNCKVRRITLVRGKQ